MISGFLITHLLLKELNASGTISLKHFYFRRALRIFPPFYVYMAVALAVTLAGWAAGDLRAFVVAATYTWNYLGGGSELLEHTWSLSLEEQFYLLWPAALVLLGTRKSSKLAVWVILLSPVSRIVTYYLAPGHRALLSAMLHTGLDSIMFGCLLAILWRNPRFNQIVQPLVRGWAAAIAAAFVLVLAPFFLDARFRGSYSLVFGLTLNAICLSLILLYVVRVPGSAAGRLLNTAVLRHLGVISYSLYLWQQMFTGVNSVRLLSLEPACDSCLRGTLLLARGTALAATEGTAGKQVAMEDCRPARDNGDYRGVNLLALSIATEILEQSLWLILPSGRNRLSASLTTS